MSFLYTHYMRSRFAWLLFTGALISSADAALVQLTFTGTLTRAEEIRGGGTSVVPVNSFGTIPMGTPFSGQFSFHNTQPQSTTMLYSYLDLVVATDRFTVGPNSNWAPPFLGSSGPGGDPSATFSGGSSISIYTGLKIGTIGGRLVGGTQGGGFTFNFELGTENWNTLMQATGPLATPITGSGGLQIMETGWFLWGNGQQRTFGTINSFTATVVPEPASSILLAGAAAALIFRRRRMA